MQRGAMSHKRPHVKQSFWIITLLICIIAFLYWFFYLRYIEFTDDAYVHGNPVALTPLHSGFVTSIHTDDTYLVEKGELLVELDKTDSQIALDLAKEELAQTVRNVCEMFHQVFVYNSEIDLKTAELIRDAQDYLHRNHVYLQKGVSLEDYEHAIASLRSQAASLEMAGAQYQKALAAVQNTSIMGHPLILAASDRVRDAWVRLVRCNLYSPVKGLAAQRTIQVGMWVPAGQPLMTIIPLDQIWINANYKETQLKRMRIGQKVDVTADLWGYEVVFHGTIVGLPGGAGNAFSLLPPQNLSGNWIKIVQRLPVRVGLEPEELIKHPLRLGLTCKALVDTRDRAEKTTPNHGEMVPKTTKGSPLYETDVFFTEEDGDLEYIQKIIANNIDPSLSSYKDTPLDLKERTIAVPSVIKEAFRQDAILQKQIDAFSKKASSQKDLSSNAHSSFFDQLFNKDFLR